MERPQNDHGRANVAMTVRIAKSYLTGNKLGAHEIGPLIEQVSRVLTHLQRGTRSADGRKLPTLEQIQASIRERHLISFENGKSYRMLKRHLTSHNITPEAYRAKWGLPDDYPMVAPFYTRKRAKLAKRTRLGHYDRETGKLPPEAPRPIHASLGAPTKNPEPRSSGGGRRHGARGGAERYSAAMA